MIVTLSVLLLVLPLLLFGLRSLWNVHWDGEYYGGNTLHMPELVFENAPEGTAYIDPLVRLDALDDYYTVFATPPYKAVTVYYDDSDIPDYELLGIDMSSEIAQYHEDGYVSLSFHYGLSGGVAFWSNDKMFLEFLSWTNENRIDRIYERCGGFRAAYVDENGNVLGVTEPAVLVYDDTKNTAFLADGSSLTLRVWGVPKWQNVILNVLIIAELCVFGALIAAVTIALIRKTLTKGELDNEENLGYN